HLSFKIKLTDRQPLISFTLTDEKTHIALRLAIHVGEETLENPSRFPHSSGFFISTNRSNEYTIVQSVRDAEIIRQFADTNYCISILHEDFQKFKEEILNPIIQHYPITVDGGDSKSSFFLKKEPLTVSRKCVHISRQGDLIVLMPTIVYDDDQYVSMPLHGNPIFKSEGMHEKVYLRNPTNEDSFRKTLRSLHSHLFEDNSTGQFSIPFSLVQSGEWI